MENEYTYHCYVTMKDKLTGRTLMNSQIMDFDFLIEHYVKICVELFFELNEDYPIDEIEFDVMRIEPEMNQAENKPITDTDLMNYLDNSILSLVNGLEKRHNYNDAQMIILHSAFTSIKNMFNKFILVAQIHTEKKINAVYEKVVVQFQSLTFLGNEEVILLMEWLKIICQRILKMSSDSEKFEISANIKKYLSSNNIYTKTQ